MINKFEVRDYNEYIKVSNEGHVFAKPRLLEYIRCGTETSRFHIGGELSYKKDKYGYIRVGYRIKGKYHNKQVHRLVAETFIPNPYGKPQVNHIDGNKTNNNVDNLEWCTQEENKRHSAKLGLEYTPKIPNELVKEIKDKYATGRYTQRQLAKEYNTQHSNIWYVLNKR